MHFVTHEMRTPLSAIQGSSELISRYALTEEKRKQIAPTDQLRIQAPGPHGGNLPQRGAALRRADGAEARSHPGEGDGGCLRGRARGRWRERKHIAITLDPIADELQLTGDRELMEYACYNLLTNAVKYSPQRTEVTVSALEGRAAMSASP